MLANYLLVALRSIRRYRIYSLINISGLAIGMACCILIFLYVRDELSYDTFHEYADNIYRVGVEYVPGGEPVKNAVVPGPVAPSLIKDFPEIITAVRFWRESVTVRYTQTSYNEERFFFVDPNVFEVFSFSLIKGDYENALNFPYTIVITEAMALKYFNDECPVGKTLTVDVGTSYDFKITGVIKDIPSNSHQKIDFLASMASLADTQGYRLKDWRNASFYTYLLVYSTDSAEDISMKLPAFLQRHIDEKESSRMKLFLQPLKSIHLHSHLEGELEANGNIGRIYTFSTIAILVLLIAGINFMNLSIAQSTVRVKEIEIRKVLGALRSQLIKQFIVESILFSFAALFCAVCLVELFLPGFNSLIGKDLLFYYSSSFFMMIGLAVFAIFVGLVSGCYPSVFLSAYRSPEVLRQKMPKVVYETILKKLLVIVQFAVSIILIIFTMLLYNQVIFLKNKQLGFNKESIIVLPMREKKVQLNYELLKQELATDIRIISTSASSHIPFGPVTPNRVEFRYEDSGNDNLLPMFVLFVDQDFLDTYGIELLEGRNFTKIPIGTSFILNETAVREFGWDTPVGKRISHWAPQTGSVIGVTKDFHFMSLHHEIEPLVFFFSPRWFQYFSVRVRSDDITSAITFIKQKWIELFPQSPFEYSFIDSQVDERYSADNRLVRMLGYFSLLAIFIACIGLFGLTSLTIKQRTKEIGIRKTLGASVPGIIVLLSKEFARLLVIANLIAWPAAYWALQKWQYNFAYKAGIKFELFLMGSALAFVVALFTISYQTVKVAHANPVESLRYE